jgi:hypothetical protein
MLRLLFWALVVAARSRAERDVAGPGHRAGRGRLHLDAAGLHLRRGGLHRFLHARRRERGRSAQDGVRVRLRTDAVQSPLIAPTVRRTNDATLVSPASDRTGVEAYPLGRLDTDERVSLVFALRAASRETVLGWDRVLVGVDPTVGSARPGEVSAVTAGRVLHAVGRRATRLIEAVRQAIAAS